MFESFAGMLRETIGAALIIGILLVVIDRSTWKILRRAVNKGIGLAIVLSMAGALVIPSLSINEETYEGVLFWVSAVAVAYMVWWMHRRGRVLPPEAGQQVRKVDDAPGSPMEAWGLGLIAFIMIFRIGPEVLASLGAVNLTTEGLLDFFGAIAGVAVALVFLVMFVHRCHQVDAGRFFKATRLLLVIFFVQLLLNGYHEFSEVGIVPATRQTMGLVGPAVRNDSLFLLAILAIALFILVVRKGEEVPPLQGSSDPEQRLFQARLRRSRFYRFGAVATVLVMISVLGIAHVLESLPKDVPPPEAVARKGDFVVIPLEKLEDGKLHRLGFLTGGRMVRFLAMKTPDGNVRTALDACEICGPFGYIQEGKNLLCLNCGAEINPLTLGSPGGCNPIPLASEIAEAKVIVPVARLQEVEMKFAEHTGVEEVDPVCGMKVRVNEAAAFHSFNGKIFYFCNMERCLDMFMKDPTAFGQ